MSRDLFNDDEEFRDIPDEVANTPAPPAPVRVQEYPVFSPTPSQPTTSEVVTTFEGDPELDLFPDGDDEDDYTEILNDANLRIEQGRLYQMIMNHDLFDGLEVDPRAVQNVQREIRKFARERMEVMLGMRRETAVVENLEIDFPFNALEVEVLRKLAYGATKGATQNSDKFVPAVKKTTEEVPVVPRRTTLNPIGSGSLKKQAPAQPQQRQAPAKPLQNRGQAPVRRERLDPKVEQILMEEGVTREDIERQYGSYTPIGKRINELTPQELEQRARETAARLARGTTVKSANALPMASPEQQELLAVQRATQVSAGPGMSALLEAVKKMPIKNV